MRIIGRVYDTIDYLGAGLFYLLSYTRRKMPPNLTPLEDILHLSPLVCRVLGQNPGPYTLQGTNTYLVGNGKEKVLIDTGEKNIPNYVDQLSKALNGSNISCIIATHYHHDHVGGISDVLELCAHRSKIPIYKFRRSDGKTDENCEQYEYVEDGHEINVEGASLKLIYTPGHTSDHMVVYLKEENSIFSGDCILGEGTTIFEDLFTYLNSLQILKKIEPSKIYPGHGPVVESPKEKISEYITHRLSREKQVIDALREIEEGATPATLARILYPDIPLTVRIGAIGNVKHHLTKLVKENRAVEVGSGLYKLK